MLHKFECGRDNEYIDSLRVYLAERHDMGHAEFCVGVETIQFLLRDNLLESSKWSSRRRGNSRETPQAGYGFQPGYRSQGVISGFTSLLLPHLVCRSGSKALKKIIFHLKGAK